MDTITIKTKSGKYIQRKAIITNWIDNNGIQYSTAQVGNAIYRIIAHQLGQKIWGIK